MSSGWIALAALAAQTPLLPPAEAPPATFAWSDFDADGLSDALVVTSAGEVRLLQNPGDGRLVDATEQAGLAAIAGASFAQWADYDLDGWPDLFVGTSSGPSRLFRNIGGRFDEVTYEAGLTDAGRDLDAGWLDYDADGLPDLLVRTATQTVLYRNLGADRFESIDLGLPAAPTARAPVAGVAADETDAARATATGSSLGELARANGREALPPDVSTLGVAPRAGTAGSGRISVAPPEPTIGNPSLMGSPICVEAIEDQSGAGCITASTIPLLGSLYPITENLFVRPANGNVGLGTTNPSADLHVIGDAFFDGRSAFEAPLAAATGEGQNGPTLGYLGVQGTDDFTGLASADWDDYEMGLVGISTGQTLMDNYGVMGHSNHVAIRGENAGAPNIDFAELGRPGIGLRASGSTSAGEFEGPLRVLDDLGDDKVAFTIEGGGALGVFEAADDSQTVQIDGESTNGGGAIGIRRSGGSANTILLLGDNGGNEGLVDVTGQVDITSATSSFPKLNVFTDNTSGVSHLVNLERTQNQSGSDILQIEAGGSAFSDSQFIEAERGADVEFRVDGSGTVYADGAFTGPADFAEMIRVSTGAGSVEAGDVVVIDPASPRSVRASTLRRSPLVVGVYSTNPGFVGSEREWDAPDALGAEAAAYERQDMATMYDEVPVAVVGIVPCKVSAENEPIWIGDLLVTSSIPGHAMRDEAPSIGTVVGKALEPLAAGTGVIRILVTLQ